MKCDIDGCGTEVTFDFARIESRRLVFQKHYCERHARECFEQFRSNAFVGAGAHHAVPGIVCVDLEMIIYHIGPEDTPGCIYLHEVGGERRFCTMVSRDAYCGLMTEVRRDTAPRPFTHAGWAATITQLGGVVQDVVVDKAGDADQWFDAKVRIRKDDRLVSVDVRPSDAYILAVITGVPILAVEKGMEKFFSGRGGW